MKTFIAYRARDLKIRHQDLITGNAGEEIRVLDQRNQAAHGIWDSWATAHDGSLMSRALGEGVIQIPAEHLGDVPALQQQYGQLLQTPVAIGIGLKPAEADLALRVSEKHGGEQIVLYRPGIEAALEDDKLEKADQVGFHEAAPAAKPQAPEQGGSPHSPTQDAVSEMENAQIPSGSPVVSESDIEDQLHDLAQRSDQPTAAPQQVSADVQKLRAQVAGVLKTVKSQSQVLAQLKTQAPGTFKALTGLIQAVIQMAKALPRQPMYKSEEVCKECHGKEEKCKKCKEALEKRNDLELPVGTVKDPSASGTKESAGHIKVSHGAGKDGWVETRAGQILATEDRHAPPILGQAGHPVSSRSPSGR